VLALLLIMFVLIAHWFACIWFTIGDVEAHNGVLYGWLQTLGRDIGDRYVHRNASGEIVWDGGPSGTADRRARWPTSRRSTSRCPA